MAADPVTVMAGGIGFNLIGRTVVPLAPVLLKFQSLKAVVPPTVAQGLNNNTFVSVNNLNPAGTLTNGYIPATEQQLFDALANISNIYYFVCFIIFYPII